MNHSDIEIEEGHSHNFITASYAMKQDELGLINDAKMSNSQPTLGKRHFKESHDHVVEDKVCKRPKHGEFEVNLDMTGSNVRSTETTGEFIGTSRPVENVPLEILVARGRFPEIVVHSNTREDDWKCDICLSMQNEEDDPLSICDMCLVVVHPSCYRRDLYS
jgi:hypothetical protein